MLQHDSTLTFDRLVAAIQGPTGWMELLVAAVGIVLAFWLSRRIHARYFAANPADWGFGKYLMYRLVLPLSAQLWTQLAAVLWQLAVGVRSELLVVSATLLFWMSVIRILTAVVRHALPDGKLERSTEHFMAMLLWTGFASWAVGVDTVVLDWLESISFRVGKNEIDLLMILSALVWVSVIMVGALWVSKLIEKRVMKLSDVDLSLRIVFTKLARTLLMVTGVLVALPIVGIDLTVLSVFGGALGVGLGFGLQKIASNYVSGFIILLDRSIRIGDRLMVDNRVGYVSKITSRFVVLKSADGSEALVPNDTLIANTVINQSYTDKSLWISLPIQVAYGTDLPQALALLCQAATHPRVKTDPAPSAFVVAFADSGINLEVGLWVSDPENGMLSLRSEINLRIWQLFCEHGIQIPYPQREVRVLNPAGNEA
ncbi:mechanosensitive ion channel family protein [Vogesella sp. XCS3]|uniref:mechanosensitive ion channel family protein n=1 Tax=Vogesella sp. XCS3 TaxID=2877939 RepID=UPI001D0AC2DE|nr:mechanosensitive ion channel domain-containing protein [Vogesella sp. XCS3]UDM17399.1 mechanosensitive ion channel [Vogesella sp. XCS3]